MSRGKQSYRISWKLSEVFSNLTGELLVTNIKEQEYVSCYNMDIETTSVLRTLRGGLHTIKPSHNLGQ